MGFAVPSQLRPQKLGELREGDVFMAHVPGDGRLVGMIGGTDTKRLLLVLGSERTTLDEIQVGWFEPETMSNETAYKIEGARLEIIPNARGYAEPAEQLRNGCVILDADDRAWIYTEAERDRVSFDLATGVSGSPKKPVRAYEAWRLVWTPQGAEAPVVLWQHPPQ